jgi:uncharacterized membrane protein
MSGNGVFPLILHVVGVVFWAGGLFAISLMLAVAAKDTEASAKVGAVAKRAAIAVDAAAALAIVGGIALFGSRSWDIRQPWMHMKLTFVLGLLAVHGIVRMRAGRAARGGKGPGIAAPIAVAVLAVIIVGLVLAKPFAL